MNVLFLGPSYPSDMPLFVRGLASVGARVIGVGDQAVDALAVEVKEALADYVRIDDWSDEHGAVGTVLHALRGREVDLVETLWEPLVVLAARLRAAIGLPGLTVDQALAFRDKGLMKQRVEAAGIRTPRSMRATTADGCRVAAREIGCPIIVKPIAGAGSMDTYRIEHDGELEAAIGRLGRVPEVSVEEFVDAEEFTYDTICAAGQIVLESVCEYRPRPLVGKQVEWISQQIFARRDHGDPGLAGGLDMGRRVIEAMGFTSGFTHMEWYRTADGEVVFGEIGARAPGARITDLVNYTCDTDVFTGWAEAVCHGTFSQPTERRFNVGMVIKRAQGTGRITRIDGLARLLTECGDHVVVVDLLEVGQHRRDWRQTVLSDGYVVVRHPDLATTVELADRFAVELHLHAGG
jgi:formate-dependent phosphoribosylglycinamide formyltransferase (GAR transformylase)